MGAPCHRVMTGLPLSKLCPSTDSWIFAFTKQEDTLLMAHQCSSQPGRQRWFLFFSSFFTGLLLSPSWGRVSKPHRFGPVQWICVIPHENRPCRAWPHPTAFLQCSSKPRYRGSSPKAQRLQGLWTWAAVCLEKSTHLQYSCYKIQTISKQGIYFL